MAVGQTLVFDIIGRETASAAFARAGAAADAASAKIAKAGKRMTAVGATLTRHITLPVVAAAVVSGKMATDFNAAMTRIQTQAGASAKDVKVLTDQVLQLAGKAQQSPLELANSLYHLKSVGLDNAKAMRALKQASDLAAVGNADLESTTNALAGAWRTGIRGATNFHHAVSTLNAIIGAGNMTMEDLNAALGTGFLPTAKTFGLSLKDVGAALAVMTDEGVPAAAAATRLRMTFSLIGAPSKKAAAALSDIGIKSLDLAKAMRQGGLVQAIGMLKDHLDGLSKVKQAQILSNAFGGGRSSAAIMSLVNNFDVLKMKEEQVTKGMDRFGADVKKQAQTPQAQFKQLISTLDKAAIELGDQLLPAAIKATHALGSFVDWFSKLPGPVKQTTGEVVLFLAALGPVMSIGGRLVTLFGGIVKALEYLGVVEKSTTAATAAQAAAQTDAAAATEAQASATTGLSTAMARVRFGAAIAGVAALGASAKTSNGFLDALGKVGGGALLGFAAGGPIGAAIGAGAGALVDLTTHIGGAAKAATGSKADFQGLASTLDDLTGAVTTTTRKFIENELVQSGTLKSLATYGITTRQAIGAILGEGSARKAVTAAIHGQEVNYQGLLQQIQRLRQANVQDAKDGNLSPKSQQARAEQIKQLQAQAAAEKHVIDSVRNGIGMTRQEIAQKRRDIAATADYTGKLKGLPKNVRTHIDQKGIYPSIHGIAELTKRYHLTPKQIRTLITASGVATSVKAVERVKAKLQEVSKTKADLSSYQASLRAGSHTAEAAARDMGFGVKRQAETGPKSAKADLSRFVSSLKSAAALARGIASTGGHAVGASLSSGVVAGIATHAADAASAQLVNNAIAAARKAANAHSPSRKMVSLGHDLMDGLLVGIADRQMTVQKAMGQIATLISNLQTKVKGLMSTRSGFLNTFTADSVFATDLSHTTTDANGNDVTTPATAADLIAFQKQQAEKARTLLHDVKKVTGEGLSKALVRQLQAEGVSGAAELHALATGTPAQIKQLNALNKQTSASLRAAGLRAGNYVRGGSINADIRLARKQEHVLEQLEHHLKELAHSEKKGQTIVVEIDSEAFIRAVHRRNKRKGVKTAGM